jgi:hypothetical protein
MKVPLNTHYLTEKWSSDTTRLLNAQFGRRHEPNKLPGFAQLS